MNKIDNLMRLLDENGIEAKMWKSQRIYFDKDRTAKCFIKFDDPLAEATDDPFDGAVLCVFSDCPGQSTKWNVNRAKQLKHKIAMELHEAGIIKEVCEKWEDIIL